MVIGVNSYFFKVVVFAADAQTFLGIGLPLHGSFPVAQEVIFELVHPPHWVNFRVGSFFTTIGAEGTIVCPFDTKKSRKFSLISELVIIKRRHL